MERFPDPAPLRGKPRLREANPRRSGTLEAKLSPRPSAPPSAAVPRIVFAPAICGFTRPTLSQSSFQNQKKPCCLSPTIVDCF
jgi:hypothetical protein